MTVESICGCAVSACSPARLLAAWSDSWGSVAANDETNSTDGGLAWRSAAAHKWLTASLFAAAKSAGRAPRTVPAKCTTASTPASASVNASTSSKPATQGEMGASNAAAGFLTMARVSMDAAASLTARRLPMNPVRPVTATVGDFK